MQDGIRACLPFSLDKKISSSQETREQVPRAKKTAKALSPIFPNQPDSLDKNHQKALAGLA